MSAPDEAVGEPLDPIRPDEVAPIVAAAVMRRLLPAHELRQLGAYGMPVLLRDTIEHELEKALRGVARGKLAAHVGLRNGA